MNREMNVPSFMTCCDILSVIMHFFIFMTMARQVGKNRHFNLIFELKHAIQDTGGYPWNIYNTDNIWLCIIIFCFLVLWVCWNLLMQVESNRFLVESTFLLRVDHYCHLVILNLKLIGHFKLYTGCLQQCEFCFLYRIQSSQGYEHKEMKLACIWLCLEDTSCLLAGSLSD